MSTAMALFQPSRDDGRALWQVIYDFITEEMEAEHLSIGDILTHENLEQASGVQRSPAYYQAVLAATRELQAQHGRSLQSVRGAGYRFIAGLAQLDKGRGYQARSRRALSKAIETTTTIDEDTLAAGDRSIVRKVVTGMRILASALDMQAERLAEHEEQIARLRVTQADNKAEVQEELEILKARIARLEQ